MEELPLRRRLSKACGLTKPASEAQMTSLDWVRRLTVFVLKFVKAKWDFHCQVYEEAVRTEERRALIREAEEIWTG